MSSCMTRIRCIRLLCFLSIALVASPLAVSAQDGTAPVEIEIIVPGDDRSAEQALAAGGTILSSSERTSNIVSSDLVQSPVLSIVEKQEAAKQSQPGKLIQQRPRPLTMGGYFRYERVTIDDTGRFDLDGNVFTLNLQAIWDFDDQFTVGVIIPYDFIDLDSFNAHRTGLVGFGQYQLPVSALSTLRFTLNSQYTYTAIEESSLDNINVGGAGATASLTIDTERVVIGGLLSYQFNANDTNLPTTEYHLMKVGANVAGRIGNTGVINVFGVWTYDLTDYDGVLQGIDDDYFDLGFDLSWSVTPRWKLTGGYKKVLGMSDVTSDMVFIGTLLQF